MAPSNPSPLAVSAITRLLARENATGGSQRQPAKVRPLTGSGGPQPFGTGPGSNDVQKTILGS